MGAGGSPSRVFGSSRMRPSNLGSFSGSISEETDGSMDPLIGAAGRVDAFARADRTGAGGRPVAGGRTDDLQAGTGIGIPVPNGNLKVLGSESGMPLVTRSGLVTVASFDLGAGGRIPPGTIGGGNLIPSGNTKLPLGNSGS